jgi:hypothetical protein
MVKRLTSDDRNDRSRGFAPAERNVEGEPVGPSFEGVVGEGTLSRRRMLGLAGGALTGLLLTPLTLSGGEASAKPFGTFTIRQVYNRRYLDAYDYPVAMYGGDYRAVTRTSQLAKNDTQRWLLDQFGTSPNYYYRIRQKSTGRYLDAWETSKDYAVMTTRRREFNDSQRWLLTPHDDITIASLTWSIQQKSTRRYLDAYLTEPNDYRAVTRDKQANNTQRWLLTKV